MKKTIFLLLISFQIVEAQRPKDLGHFLKPTVFATTMVMIHDVVNPPAASRFYAYSLLGAQEIIARNNKNILSPMALVKRLKPIEISEKQTYNYQIAALYSILETGRIMMPSGEVLAEEQSKFIESLKLEGIQELEIERAIGVAKEVSKQIAADAASDNYLKLSALRRYRPLKGEAYWYPTPPGYIEGIEPNWKTIKTMLIDSCNQFVPVEPVPYSSDTTSEFYRQTMEVYQAVNNLNEETTLIASFWDCNPFAINTSGHMMIGFKKISPGGHWMGIAGIASEKAKLSLDQSVLVHSLVGITLMDAFISCWDEKYRSNRIRPETVINRLIDKRWQPLLQTPPFPEYTSGHSVISTAAAETLTYLFGDHFSFSDDTEIIFDLPVREFKSFRLASEEAAISRLYGGIHYRDAIVYGQKQGREIGQFVVKKLKQAGVGPLIIRP